MQIIQTEQSNRSIAHYSLATAHNHTLYLSGQLPRNMATGELIAGGIREQTQKTLENIEEVLTLAGCTKEDVLKCTIYTVDAAYWGDINEVYGQFFQLHKPARVLIPIRDLKNGCLIEIEAIAQIK